MPFEVGSWVQGTPPRAQAPEVGRVIAIKEPWTLVAFVNVNGDVDQFYLEENALTAVTISPVSTPLAEGERSAKAGKKR